MANDRKNTGRKARRIAAAAMLAFAFVAIMVHGRATRAVQIQPAKLTIAIEAVDRPLRA